MVAKRSPDWLPAGWTVQFKLQKRGRKIEFYTNLETGKNFFSRDDVMRYIKMASTRSKKPQPTTVHSQNHSEKNPSQLVVNPAEYPQWLPNGWKVEMRTRKTGVHVGKEYKCYIDPSTEYTFYSKPEVFRYLKTVKRRSCNSRNHKTVDVERHNDEDLPAGWIKEIKVRKYADRIRRDPYYTDPASGYVFRSKKDVFHYLETGEISRHAFKPKSMDLDDLKVVDDEIAPSAASKRQKLKHPVTRQQHFGDKGSSEVSGLEIPETVTSKLQDKRGPAETGVAFASTVEVVQEKHFNEYTVEKCAKTECDSPTRSTQLEAELSDGHEVKRSLLEIEDSVVDIGNMIFAGNKPVLTPDDNTLNEDSPKAVMEKSDVRKARTDSSKSKNKGKLNLPRRSSKRLAGVETRVVFASTAEVVREKHITENVVEEYAKTEEDCSPSRSTQPEAECSDRHEGKRSLCEVECSVIDPGNVTFTGNELVLTPAANSKKENSPKTLMEKSNVRKVQIDSSKSKNKGKLNLPRRTSKRLAGVGTGVAFASTAEVIREKHFNENMVEECAKTEEDCSPSRPAQSEAELSDRHDGKRSLFEVEYSLTYPGNMILDRNEPVSTPAADTMIENSPKTVMAKSNSRKAQINSSKSKNKGKLNLSCRSSKRLAGVEPEQIANLVSSERPLQAATRKSRKSHTSQVVGLASDNFVNRPSQQIGAASETEVLNFTSTDIKSTSHEEPLNKDKMPLEDQFVPKEQQPKLETEKMDAEKPEPQLSFLFGSDPCLEFAFKTLTGELPIADTVDDGPILKPAADMLQKENSLESGMEKSLSRKTRANKSKKNKELQLPHRSSKRLAHVEPEGIANTMSTEQALRKTSAKSCKSKAIATVELAYETSQQPEVGPEAKLTNHSCSTLDTAMQEESSNKTEKSLEDQAVPQDKPQQFETEKADVQNPAEPHFCFPFVDSWSDPCLDFAFKTLTGAIPVEDDLFQSYFQEKPDTSHSHKDSLEVSDFGLASFFQNDILPQFDAPEQSVSGQQLSMNSLYLPSGNVSMSDCNGVASSQQLSMNPSFPHAGNASMPNCGGFGSGQPLSMNPPFLPTENASVSNYSGVDPGQLLSMNPSFLPAGNTSLSNYSAVCSSQPLSMNSSLLPAGNASLSNCGAVGSQKPCLGGTKDYHGKVKS